MHISWSNRHTVMLAMTMMLTMVANGVSGIREVEVGVILDMDSDVGKSTRICILMALEEVDGAQQKNNITTIIRFHIRDSRYDNIEAMDLLKHTQVIALLGPQQLPHANFVLDLAYKSKVPIISQATSPDLSSKRNPYFIRIAQTSSTQAEPIAALVKSFGWTEVVFVYEDTDFGRGAIPYLFDAMVNISTQVKYQALLSPYSTDDLILQQLHILKTIQTRVFVVHMLPALASRFFKKANEVGMMAREYAWIITDVLTGLLRHLSPRDLDSMQGVLGVKPYIPPSNQLTNFERRWKRRVLKEYPEIDIVELDMFGIWSYDFTFALATALQRVETESGSTFNSSKKASLRSKILPIIRNIRIKGLSGDFHVVNGQLQTFGYQIVNVIGKGEKHVGFWNFINGLSNRVSENRSLGYTTSQDDLGAIIWPGDTPEIPKGWDNNNNSLQVGVPAPLTGFVEFFEAYRDPATNIVYTNGFCLDVFRAIIDAMSNVVDYEIIPYETPDGESTGNTNDLVYQIVRGKFDMVAGDAAVAWNRSNDVDIDYSLPYLEAGYAITLPVKVDERINVWIFMEPLETMIWITISVLFIYIGLVVWVLEHHVNNEFRGRPSHQQVWMILSTLVFAHRERSLNNLSRFLVMVWVIVALVLTSCYTASLSSMLTVQKLQPTITNINELVARGDYVGYQGGSFVEGLLENIGFPDENSGVSVIVDGIRYVKMSRAQYCNRYLIVGPTYKTAGFAFAFPEGSPHVASFSRAILKAVQGQMRNIEDDHPDINGEVQTFDKLTLASRWGLLSVVVFSSAYALIICTRVFLCENKDILVSNDSMYQKMTAPMRGFNEENEGESLYEAEVTDDDLMRRMKEKAYMKQK